MSDGNKFVSIEEIANQKKYADSVRALTDGKGFKAHIITLGCQQNVAIDLVLRVQKMHVTGSTHGLIQFLAKPHHLAVKLPQVFFIVCHSLL